MISFTLKERFVAGGHRTDPPSSITYSSVVSRDSIRLGSMLIPLNDLYICSVGTCNAYLNYEFR